MNTSWARFGDSLILHARNQRIPLIGQLELTSRCNLRCKMCYVCNESSSKGVIANEKTAKEWIDFARQIRDAGVLYLLLTGGEVFIRPDFQEIYEAISEMGFSVQIYTNATLITPEIAKWLGKRPPSRISVTMYGASQETYKAVTGSAEAYEKIKNSIELMLNEKLLVTLRSTAIKGNVNDANAIFDYAQSKGIVFGISPIVSPSREKNTMIDPVAERLSPQEYIDYVKSINVHISSSVSNFEKKVKENDADDILQIVENIGKSSVDNAFSCAAGHCSFWVTWDGKMVPCGMMNNPGVDVFANRFTLAWEELKNECDKIPKSQVCSNCKIKDACSKCPAKLNLETEKYDECSDYLKEVACIRMSSVIY